MMLLMPLSRVIQQARKGLAAQESLLLLLLGRIACRPWGSKRATSRLSLAMSRLALRARMAG